MVKWYKYLYVGSRIEKKKKRCMCCIEEGKRLRGFYVIALASNVEDQLEIMAANELSHPMVKERIPLIVGLALDYTEAMDILYQIIDDAEAANMRGCLRAYIEKKEGLQKTLC